MTLVFNQRAATILKAKRRVTGRLADTPEGKKLQAITEKYQARFARAFTDAVKDMLTPADKRAFKKAWGSGSIVQIMEAMPFFDDPETSPDSPWVRFTNRIKPTYEKTLDAAAQYATGKMNRELGTDLRFNVNDTSQDKPEAEVLKASRFANVGNIQVVPINPYSKKWIDQRALGLVQQNVTGQQREAVRDAIQAGFDQGQRAEEVYEQISQNIGLTARDAKAVRNRRSKQLELGMPQERVDSLSERYSNKLLKRRAERIARTETITAQAQGRSDAWKVAQENGQLPEVERMWIARGPGPNPNAPCPICLDLDGRTAPIGGSYDSTFLGSIDGPAAHPDCVCTETLQRKKQNG